MSKSTIGQVVQRAISDAAFRRQLQADPHKALNGFDLTGDERAAITSGDPARLTALGVDQRMSKAFALGTVGEASKVIVGDAGGSSRASLIDDGSAGGSTSALISGEADNASPLVTPGDNFITAGAIDADPTTGATASEFEASGAPGTMSIDEGSISGGSTLTGTESTSVQNLRLVEGDLDVSSSAATDGSGAAQHLRQIEGDLDVGTSSTDASGGGAGGTQLPTE